MHSPSHRNQSRSILQFRNYIYLPLSLSLSVTRISSIDGSKMSSSEAEMPVAAEQAQARTATFTLFFPFIMGFATSAPPPQEGENRTVVPEGIVLINPFTGSLMMVSGNMEPPVKEGPLPASKASIEAMPAVKIMEEGLECAICLAEYEVGAEAKEMPCKHRYHSECIEKWLGIHGTCPVCRYKMPVEEDGENQKAGQGRGGENSERRAEGEVRINFFFGGGGSDQRDSITSPAGNSVGDSSNDGGRSDGDAADTEA